MRDEFLLRAIELARQSVEAGGGPFGALIVKEGKIIAESGNRVTKLKDPTAHAEILAIRRASNALGHWHLNGCELYTSCEPCPMCMGAVYWAHIEKVYYGSSHEDARKAGFDDTDIYGEVRKLPHERHLPMISKYREQALEAFTLWKNLNHKDEY